MGSSTDDQLCKQDSDRKSISDVVCGISTDDQYQQLRKQVSEPKSISDFIDLYLPVCSGIDSIKSDTNSEYPNVHCGILAPVNGIIN